MTPEGISYRHLEKWAVKGVESCIMSQSVAPNVKYVDYQPGNATKYVLVFTYLGELLGRGHLGTMLVSLINMKSSCMTVYEHGEVGYLHVAEALRVSEADALPLAALINHALKIWFK